MHEAAEAIAAAFGFPTIAVENPHPKIGGGVGLKKDESVGADAKFPVAERGDVVAECEGAVVDQEKIVARALEFNEPKRALFSRRFNAKELRHLSSR